MKWLIVWTVVVLGGCASPKVFLTTERLSENQRVDLVDALSEAGFNVVSTVGVHIPTDFPDTVVATNPANENAEFFSALEQVVRQQALGPVVYRKFYEDKHYYQGVNVGLYVRGDEPKMRLPPVLRGSNDTCNSQRLILEFSNDNTVTLDVEAEDIRSYTGQYQTQLPNTLYADFNTLTNPVTMTLSRVSVNTYAGKKRADKIVVAQSDTNVLPVGCEFMIIHY